MFSIRHSWSLQRELEVSSALPTIPRRHAPSAARTTGLRRRLQGLRAIARRDALRRVRRRAEDENLDTAA